MTTLSPPARPSTRPVAQPSFSMNSAVIGLSPTRPRIPSVPKYFLDMVVPQKGCINPDRDYLPQRRKETYQQELPNGFATLRLKRMFMDGHGIPVYSPLLIMIDITTQ
jgi:hypothetical protein